MTMFLDRVRKDGHTDVALGGETLFLQMGDIQSLTTGVDPLDNKMCLRDSQLETTYNMWWYYFKRSSYRQMRSAELKYNSERSTLTMCSISKRGGSHVLNGVNNHRGGDRI